MTIQDSDANRLRMPGLRHLRKYRLRTIAAALVAISPPIICACFASNSGNWDFFERSGSITTAVGLLTASRRYIQYGVLELARLQERRAAPDSAEMLEEVITAKLGMALSAFGTVIWGWGKYLGWWSFICLVVWALFAARDALRDQIA